MSGDLRGREGLDLSGQSTLLGHLVEDTALHKTEHPIGRNFVRTHVMDLGAASDSSMAFLAQGFEDGHSRSVKSIDGSRRSCG